MRSSLPLLAALSWPPQLPFWWWSSWCCSRTLGSAAETLRWRGETQPRWAPEPWARCVATVLLATMPQLTLRCVGSRRQSPAAAAEAPAPRAGDRLGSQPCRGVPWRLPKTGSPVFERKPTRLPCTHQRGNLRVPPRAAPSRLETLKAASAPGVGRVGMGPPPRTPPKKPC